MMYLGTCTAFCDMARTETLRKRVYAYYERQISLGNASRKKSTVEHFVSEGESRSTIYDIINRYEAGRPPESRHGGRTSLIFDKKGLKKLTEMMDNTSGVSQAQAAAKFGCTQQYVSQTLREKTSIRRYRKKTIPDRTEAQKMAAQPKCSTLVHKYRNFEWILDDESYFTLANTTIDSNKCYYSSDRDQAPERVKYAKKAKYGQQLLVWIAMSPAGLTKPFISPSGLAINAEIYVNKCLKPFLLPFIRKHHSESKYVFWPDLASSHYAETTCDFLIEKNINFVEKFENPANLPEARPIERFWALLKAQVYKNDWKASNLEELEKKIRFCIKNFDPVTLHKISTGVFNKIDTVRRHGVEENN